MQEPKDFPEFDLYLDADGFQSNDVNEMLKQIFYINPKTNTNTQTRNKLLSDYNINPKKKVSPFQWKDKSNEELCAGIISKMDFDCVNFIIHGGFERIGNSFKQREDRNASISRNVFDDAGEPLYDRKINEFNKLGKKRYLKKHNTAEYKKLIVKRNQQIKRMQKSQPNSPEWSAIETEVFKIDRYWQPAFSTWFAKNDFDIPKIPIEEFRFSEKTKGHEESAKTQKKENEKLKEKIAVEPKSQKHSEKSGIKSFPLPEGEVAGAQKIRSKAGTKISEEAGESHGSPFTDFVKNICRLQNKQRIPGLYEGDLRSQEASTEKVKQQNPRKLKLEKELPPLSTENLNALVTPYFKNGVPNCNALAKHIMKAYGIKTNNKSVKKFLQLKGYV